MSRTRLLFAALATVLLSGGAFVSQAQSDPTFFFRYKAAAISTSSLDPDCDPETETCGEGGGETELPPISTVEPETDWDNKGGELALVATDGSTSVTGGQVAYQCYKATGGVGNYGFGIEKFSGDTNWIQSWDIVTKADLSTPFGNLPLLFNSYYIAPPVASGRISMVSSGEACVRVLVKEGETWGTNAFTTLYANDYPASMVTAGSIAQGSFRDSGGSETFASVDIAFAPSCTGGCNDGTAPGSPFRLDPVYLTSKVDATHAYHNFDHEARWNGADSQPTVSFIAKGGNFPYVINASIGQGKWTAKPDYSGVGCLISASTPLLLDSSPGSENQDFTGSITVGEAGGASKHFDIAYEVRNVDTPFFDSGSTMSITIPDCNGEYGPDYVAPTPITEVTIESVSGNPDEPGTAPAPLDMVMTTRQDTGGLFYQCFNATGGYGNYYFGLGSTSGPGPQADWAENVDIVDPASLASPVSNDNYEYPLATTDGTTWFVGTTTQGGICARIEPKADGSGNREPLQLIVSVFDYEDPDPSYGPPPATNADFNGLIDRNFTVTPVTSGGGEGGDPDNGDGVCQVGEHGEDCNGVCEMGESGSLDCDGGAAPVNNADFVCQPGESGSDCDETCSPTEETSIDCPIPAEWTPADLSGFGSAGSQVGGGASSTDSVFDIVPQIGYLELAPFAPLNGGGYFGYHCFYVSNGSWPNWDHFLWVDEIDGDFPWLTNLDLVYKSDLYFGTVATYSSFDHTGRRLPEGLVGTTTQTNVCARWIVQRPDEADRQSVTLRLGSYNVDGNTLDGSAPYVLRIKEMELTPRH